MLKIKRIFRNLKHEKYFWYEEIDATTDNLREKCGKCVAFRGGVYSWQMYDTETDPIELFYTEVRDEFLDSYKLDEIVGSLYPAKIECDCGFVEGRSAAHYPWCDTLTLDPWEDK